MNHREAAIRSWANPQHRARRLAALRASWDDPLLYVLRVGKMGHHAAYRRMIKLVAFMLHLGRV